MTENEITMSEITAKLGFGGFSHTMRSNIYSEIAQRLEKEMVVKRNKKFGWTDIMRICMGEKESDGEFTYVAIFDKKLCRVTFETGIDIEGDQKACLIMRSRIFRWLKTIDLGKLLFEARFRMRDPEREILDNWCQKAGIVMTDTN